MKQFITTILLFIALIACTSETENAGQNSTPSNLVYTPNTLTYIKGHGTTSSSEVPTINKGSSEIQSYTLQTTPTGISIDKTTGKITVTDVIEALTHKLTVIATNAEGSTPFKDVFTVVAKDTARAPSGLLYSPNTHTFIKGSATFTSATPTVQSNGANITSYKLAASVQGVSIDQATGVLTVTNDIEVGEYALTIDVTNRISTTSFTNAYRLQVTEAPTKPKGISYSPDSLVQFVGSQNNSATPSILTGGSEVTAVVLSPTVNGISINSSGVIAVTSSAEVGSYTFSVTLTNAKGDSTFNNVYKVIIKAAEKPSGLAYSPNPLNLFKGVSGQAQASIQRNGSDITSYAFIGTPPTGVTISSNDGKISASSDTPLGSHTLSVKVTNGVGSTDFTSVLTIEVTEKKTTFTDIKPLVQSNCSGCHTGGGQTNYTLYSNMNTSEKVNTVIERMERTPGADGFMPKNGARQLTDMIEKIKAYLNDGLQEK